MAATTFAVLQALDRMPVGSQTDASIVNGYHRWVEVNGPFKCEYNYFQCEDGEDFTDEDTFVSGLAHPIAVSVEWVNVDAAENGPPSAILEGVESSATFKTVTVYDAHDTNDAGIIVKVYGY